MAGIPAAVLRILVDASTGGAAAELTLLDKKLRKTSTTASDAGQRIEKGMKYGGAAVLGIGAVSVYAAAKFESSFAEVRKTVDATDKEFDKIETGLRDLSKEIPVSVNELNNLAGEAGALGIKSKDIVGFTKVAAELGTTTNLSSEEASNALARFSNIMGTSSKDFDRLGATLVGLGNDGASTEREISDMALRIAGAGKQVGLSEDQVLSYSSALASVGINAEAGGSAISRAFIEMSTAVETNNDKLATFAEVAGMSTGDFAAAFKDNAAGAMIAFTQGLETMRKNGGGVFETLEELGFSEVRLRDALLRASGAGDLFNDQLATGAREWKKNTALTDEAGKRYETFESQLQVLKNTAEDLFISIGQDLLPDMKELVGILTNPKLTLDEKVAAVGEKLTDMIEEWGPKVAEAGGKLGISLVKGVAAAFFDSSILGKLFIGAAAIRLFGGPGALASAGKMIGARLGTTIASTMPTTAATAQGAWTKMGTLAGRLVGPAMGLGIIAVLATDPDVQKAIKKLFGEELGATTREKFSTDLYKAGLTDQSFKGKDKVRVGTSFGDLIFNAETGRVIDARSKALEGVIGKNLEGVINRLRYMVKWDDAAGLGGLVDSLNTAGRSSGDFRKDAVRNLDSVAAGLTDTRKVGETQLARLVSALDGGGEQAKKYAIKSGKAYAAAGQSATSMQKAVDKAIGLVRSQTQDALGELGIKAVGFATSVAKAGGGGGPAKRQFGGLIPGLRTGALVPGVGSGDKVPLHMAGQHVADVEPGELVSVANRTATAALMGVNSEIRRLADGGMVDPPGPGTGVVNAAIAPVVGRWSQAYDAAINYGYDPGGGHLSPGHNVTGTATDTGPAGGWGAGPTALFERGLQKLVAAGLTVLYGSHGVGTPYPNHGYGNHAHIEWGMHPVIAGIGKANGMAIDEIKRLMVEGPDGALKSIGQGAVDKVRDAANAFLAKQAPAGFDNGGRHGPLGNATVKGRATWFTGGTMASGLNTDTDPGIALNPNAGGPDPESWNNPTTQGWLNSRQRFLVRVGNKSAVLPVLDMGPAGWTGNAIDVNLAGVRQMGYDTGNFPSGSIGTAQAVKRMMGGEIPFAGWFGNGGEVTADRRTLIGIGDRGRETAVIQPASAPPSPNDNGRTPVALVLEDGHELRGYIEDVAAEQGHNRAGFTRQRERMRR